MIEKGTESSFSKITCLVLGHFVTDLYPAFLAPLLPLLIDKFQISLTSASLLATVLVLSTSLTQPLFGFLFDRLGGRRIMVFGPAIGGLSISLIGLAPHYSFLIILLTVGGLGIASFHPEAATLAVRLSGQRRTWGMSIFMLGGNLGHSLGSVLILMVVTGLGLGWSFLTSLPAVGMAWMLYRSAPIHDRAPKISSPSSPPVESNFDRRLLKFGILLSVVVLRVTTILSLITFLPMVQKLRGFSLMVAGSSNTIFIACGAFGGVLGGYLADRVGRRSMIISSFLFAIPTLLSFLYWKGPGSFFVLALLGFLLFLSEPSCIVLAQEMASSQARTASGLVMGMAWGLGSFGVLATGALADALGIESGLRLLLVLPAGSLILSFFLPRR